VLAVFPETTSFYKAVVAKNPKPLSNGRNNYSSGDVVVRVFSPPSFINSDFE
jgi:hypothetical protein